MKALMIVTSLGNRQEILLSLWKLAKANIEYVIVSPHKYYGMEKEEGVYEADYTIDEFELDVGEYDIFVVTGGNPRYTALIYDNPKIFDWARQFDDADKIICAVCGSQVPIKNILRGRRVTIFPRKKMLKIMSKAGAIIEDKAIVVDRNLVTAKGEMMTEMMIDKVIELAMEKQSKGEVTKPRDLNEEDVNKFPTV